MTIREQFRAPQDSTIRRRELGIRLRTAMTQSGWLAKDLARFLGQSESVVSRLLSGLRAADELEVAVFLTACKVTGAEQDTILALCRPSIAGTFCIEGEQRWNTFRRHADDATHITEFHPTMVPWSFQTSDYTRVVLAGIGADVAEGERWHELRANLSRRISSAPDEYVQLFLHEWALRTQVGSRATMSDQLHRLLRLSVAPSVSLRVVPADVGMHAGVSGAFSLLTFDKFDPAVYHEDEHAGWYVETAEAVTRCRWVIRELKRVALDEGDTRALLRKLAAQLSGSDKHMIAQPDDDGVKNGVTAAELEPAGFVC